MLKQFLAQYLFNKNLLNKHQIIEILDNDSVEKVSPGIIAIHKGLLTAVQVEDVQQIQLKNDKLFGEVALECGFLNESQLEEINQARLDVTLAFMQAIINKGYMSMTQLQRALEEYRIVNKMAEEEFSDNDELKISPEHAKLYGKYINAFMNALRKFAGLKPKIVPARPLEAKGKWLIAQNMVGQESLGTGILISEKVLFALAKAYSDEEISDDERELALDCVAEFLNVLNGLFIVSLSNENIDVDLESQHISEEVVPVGSNQMNVEIETEIGRIQLLIATDSLL